ncbi:MAG: topoisomerase DNA-binding C4 zinc finger domain-containing protein [Candidatus Lokiarchaeota archaeon]|nr:topoisomerase DNA-binding C4 zinc finger domain-containing protein [Candidatus Lokiarchaeota archaeon]
MDSLPKFCEQCGSPLLIRKGPYGEFLGCTGYPNCNYIFNLSTDKPILCPGCGSPLVVRKGQYGLFLGCSSYPRCKYLFDFKNRYRRKRG